MTYSVNIDLQFDEEEKLNTIYESLKIEAKLAQTHRGKVTIARNDLILRIIVESNDLVALRGLTNSILRLLKTAVEVINLI